MKLQDKHPFDSTILGLSDIYHTIDSDSFYVNSNCILATNKIITRGKDYIIFDRTNINGIKMIDVQLMDIYYREGVIHLIVHDIRSDRVFTIDHCLECPEDDCKWILIDINYFIDKMDAKTIRQYCGKCNDPKKKPNTEIYHESSQDDLLEFEF